MGVSIESDVVVRYSVRDEVKCLLTVFSPPPIMLRCKGEFMSDASHLK